MQNSVSRSLTVIASLLLLSSWWQSSNAADLVEVYRLSLKNDAELMIAEADYNAAIQALPLAQSVNKPQVFFNIDALLRETDNSDTGRSSHDTIGYGLNLTQAIYDTTIRGDINVAEANSEVALSRLKSVRQDLILRTAQAYFTVLAAEDNLDFAEAERTAIARQLEEAQKRFEVGLIAITDVYEAQASFDSAEARVILADNILENSLQSLVVITADSSIRKLAPLGENLKLSMPDPISVAAWVLLAATNNLDLIAAQQNLNAARYQRDKQNRNRNPTVDLFASYGDDNRNDTLLGDGRQQDLIVGVELQVPLFTGGRIGAERDQAEAQYVSAQNTVLLQSRLSSQQSRTAYLDVVSGISQVTSLKQAVKSADIALEATRAGFEVGTRTSVDVLISTRETFRQFRDYAGARYDYVLNKLRLKQAAGILQADDLKDINAYLTQ
jgi:outer membrane protein